MYWLIGIGAVVVAFIVFAMFFVKSAPCPKCSKDLVLGRPSQCPHCQSFWVEAEGRHAPLPPGFFVEDIDVFPPFKTKLSDLVPRENLRLPWKGRCCVCGGPATRAEVLKFESAGGGLLWTATVHVLSFDVEHCGRHKNGVWHEEPFQRLVFKSHDYWREFLALNLPTQERG